MEKVDNKQLKIGKGLVFKLLPFPLPTKCDELFTIAINIDVGYKIWLLFTQIIDKRAKCCL